MSNLSDEHKFVIRSYEAENNIKRGLSYPMMIVELVITAIVVIFFFWNLANFHYLHEYTLPADAPGELTTNKFGLFWWTTHVGVIIIIIVLLAMVMRVMKPLSEWYRIIHLITAVLFLFYVIVNVIVRIIESVDCNNDGLNICNDERYCCVYGTQVTLLPPASVNEFCPILLAPCVPAVTADELGWNMTFTIDFVLSWIMFVLAIFNVILATCLKHKITKKQRNNGRIEMT